jgi:anti-sigma factor RsiW
MDTVLTPDPIHRELALLLPWYVNGRLDAEEARQVEAHLAICPSCQRDVAELSRLLQTQAEAYDHRPVDEGKMHALLDRIEGAEKQQPSRVKKGDTAERTSAWEALGRWVNSWLGAQPALIAAAVAVVTLGIVVSTVMDLESKDGRYDVLSSSDPATEEFRMKLRFQGSPARADVEKLVSSSVREQKVQGAYRIDEIGGGEYVVIFKETPAVETVAGLLMHWQQAPNVAQVSVDGSAAP